MASTPSTRSLKFAMFFLGEYVNMVTVSALATTMFLGGWRAPARHRGDRRRHVQPRLVAGLLWFVVKLWLFMFFFVWLRGSLPRRPLRPVHAVRLEVPHPGHPALGRRGRLHPRAPQLAASATTSLDAADRRSPSRAGLIARRGRRPRAAPGVWRRASRPPAAAGGRRTPRRGRPRSPAATPSRPLPGQRLREPRLTGREPSGPSTDEPTERPRRHRPEWPTHSRETSRVPLRAVRTRSAASASPSRRCSARSRPRSTPRRSARPSRASTAGTSSTGTPTAWRSASAASCAPGPARPTRSTSRARDNTDERAASPRVSATAASTRSTTCAASSAACASRPARPGR